MPMIKNRIFFFFSKLILGYPKIIPFSFPSLVDLNTPNLVVSCSLSSGSKPIVIEWLKNGKSLMNNGHRVTFKNEEMFSVLMIRDLSLDDVGNYTCIAKNSYGSDQYTSSLVIICKLSSIL